MGEDMTTSEPFDEAWNLLKSDLGFEIAHSGEKVEKIVPLLPLLGLLAAGGFGLAGAKRGSGLEFYDEQGKFNPGFRGQAKIINPVTGGMGGSINPLLGEKDIGTSIPARVAGGLVGGLQAFNPLAIMGVAGRLARLGRAGDVGKVTPAGMKVLREAAQKRAVQQSMAATNRAAMPQVADDLASIGASPFRATTAPKPFTPEFYALREASMSPVAMRAGAKAAQESLEASAKNLARMNNPSMASRAGQLASRAGQSKSLRALARIPQLLGSAPEAFAPLSYAASQYLMNDQPSDQSGMGYGGFGGYGDAEAGFGEGGGYGSGTGQGKFYDIIYNPESAVGSEKAFVSQKEYGAGILESNAMIAKMKHIIG